jgi:IclR family pca regulon transcriptional regulator
MICSVWRRVRFGGLRAQPLCDHETTCAMIAQLFLLPCMTIAKADFIEGIAKGMAVLESFDTERQRLNATLAAERAGLTRAAARRHLLTLSHLGYLETDGSYFWMAPKVLRFSGSYLASSRLPRALQPTLNRLAAQTRESFSAVVLDGEEVVIVARSGSYGAPGRVLAYGLHLGARLPAHATSTGRVLLAAMAPAQFTHWLKARHLPRLTPHTVTQVRALRQCIAQVRKDDFCFASEEHEIGVQALAVPLRDMQGRTAAALNVVLSGGRHQEDQLRRDLLPLLFEAAREVRSLL